MCERLTWPDLWKTDCKPQSLLIPYWHQLSISLWCQFSTKEDGNLSALKCELWTLWEVARCRATPRLDVGLTGLVAWEMRYKNEWFNIIILFIDTHSKYTLLDTLLQGGPAGFNIKTLFCQILLNHPVLFLQQPRSFHSEVHISLYEAAWNLPWPLEGARKWDSRNLLEMFLHCWVCISPQKPIWKTRAFAVRRSISSPYFYPIKCQSKIWLLVLDNVPDLLINDDKDLLGSSAGSRGER